jgi:hypothetical protein
MERKMGNKDLFTLKEENSKVAIGYSPPTKRR